MTTNHTPTAVHPKEGPSTSKVIEKREKKKREEPGFETGPVSQINPSPSSNKKNKKTKTKTKEKKEAKKHAPELVPSLSIKRQTEKKKR
jgi:hypothetical protein